MALADRTQITKTTIHGTPCSVGEVYRKLEDDPIETGHLNAMLYELGWSQKRVWSELTAEGFTVGEQTVNSHRGTGCRCFKFQPFRFCHNCRYNLSHCVCEDEVSE